MKRVVVDASVLAAAFLPEPHTKAAQSLLVSGKELLAPELIYAEVANVLWKRRTRGEIDDDEAEGLLADVLALPLRVTASEALIGPALQLALRARRTVYDCLYLALAVATKSVLLTNDRRLVNALSRGPLGAHVAWLAAEHG